METSHKGGSDFPSLNARISDSIPCQTMSQCIGCCTHKRQVTVVDRVLKHLDILSHNLHVFLYVGLALQHVYQKWGVSSITILDMARSLSKIGPSRAAVAFASMLYGSRQPVKLTVLAVTTLTPSSDVTSPDLKTSGSMKSLIKVDV
ncbi:hypothetical protein Acr_04g0002160 [Actinidia rufa]|uniref:Uncharacterized protein n=1 Tax=Actinidia rufa TaxID=165716 RepID=A0A7J0EG76_9ERIC|nr:hypothetical protein Acr_04g0002160 [Actinidia rufa]